MESTRIHGGTLTFSEGRHQYHWNSRKVKRTVSGICGEGYPLPFGVPAAWSAKMIRESILADFHNGYAESGNWEVSFWNEQDMEDWVKESCSAHTRARDSAGGAGTEFHDYMERYSLGLEPELPEEQPARRSAEALRDWYDAHVKRPISTERLVYHPDYEYAGKLDLFCELNDDTTAVLDFKGVTNFKYPPKAGHVGQGAAYCMALRLENIQVDSFILMEVERETGKLRVTQYKDLDHEFSAFIWALNLVRYKPAGQDIT
jgi:hypothetical protein